ncbi:MAG TPA: hypothetical protein VF587_02615 [Solirubrobacteraceae bacterium]
MALSLIAAAPASAGTYPLVAVGDAANGPLTKCTVTVTKTDYAFSTYYKFSGKTVCDVPLQQSGQAFFADTAGPLCSAFTTTCESGGGWEGEPNPGSVTYRVRLRAPEGQGWVTSLPHCNGVGTDNLTCEFTADNVLTVST